MICSQESLHTYISLQKKFVPGPVSIAGYIAGHIDRERERENLLWGFIATCGVSFPSQKAWRQQAVKLDVCVYSCASLTTTCTLLYGRQASSHLAAHEKFMCVFLFIVLTQANDTFVGANCMFVQASTVADYLWPWGPWLASTCLCNRCYGNFQTVPSLGLSLICACKSSYFLFPAFSPKMCPNCSQTSVNFSHIMLNKTNFYSNTTKQTQQRNSHMFITLPIIVLQGNRSFQVVLNAAVLVSIKCDF